MLVKILSFIASVLSNARYKAVLIPCIVLVLSITSLTAVALVHDSGSRNAASTAGNASESTGEKKQSASPQISAGAQDTKDSTSQPVADGQNGSSSTSSPDNATPNQSTKPMPTSVEVALSAATLTVEPDSSSNSVTATASDNTPLTWTINPEANEAAGLQIVTEKSKDAAASFSFHFRASGNATPGSYQFVVTAKDANRGVNISKAITVVVVAP